MQDHDEIFVIVNLKQQTAPMSDIVARTKAAREVQTRVLNAISAADFRVTLRMPGGSLRGYVTKDGLRRLVAHPDVESVGLPGRPPTHPAIRGGRP